MTKYTITNYGEWLIWDEEPYLSEWPKGTPGAPTSNRPNFLGFFFFFWGGGREEQ